jgi:Fe-S cluster assembly iron-binding protein IscA
MDYAAELRQIRRQFGRPGFLWFSFPRTVREEDRIPDPGRSEDPLDEFWDVQDELLATGEVVWAARIQANQRLYAPGQLAYPGEYLASFDPYFVQHAGELCTTAGRVYDLKGTRPEDPKLRRVAERITDEYYRSLGERLPKKLTRGREIRRFTVMILPGHLPDACLTYRLAPLIVKEGLGFAMILPHWYWTPALLDAWEPTAKQRLEFASRYREHLLTVTDAALAVLWQIYEGQNEDPNRMFVRLEIDNRVNLCLDPHRNPEDQAISIDGLTFLLDPETAEEHYGAEIDFHDDGERRGFVVHE